MERSIDKLVIIGANDFQNQLIIKAKELGYETHVFAWEQGAVGKENADFFYPISIVEKDEILNICQSIHPKGICSIASDLAAITVNYVAEKLGLPCNPTEFVPIQTNKFKMREALRSAGICCPNYLLADEGFHREMLEDFHFPIIVKPTDRSGSRCITKLDSLDGLEAAVSAAREVSFEKKAIIEEFIEGDEYSMETVTQSGIHHYLATTKKYTTGAPHFIETGHCQPSGLTVPMIQKAQQIVFQALDALHVKNSAAHSEFRIDAEGAVHIIEIGARMGGDCIGSDLVPLSTGYDFMKTVIDIATGESIALPSCPSARTVVIRFLFSQRDIDEMIRFKEQFSERVYRISQLEMENLGKTEDSGTRIGYYIILD